MRSSLVTYFQYTKNVLSLHGTSMRNSNLIVPTRNAVNLPTHRRPKKYWKSLDNQQKFLDELAVRLEIKDPTDWGKISKRSIYAKGGGGLLSIFHDSVFGCLQAVYKGFLLHLFYLPNLDKEWKKEWFINTHRVKKWHWKSLENRKTFLDEVARKLSITTPSDWGKVTTHQFFKLGGGGLLNTHYRGSLFACLQSVYKGIYISRIVILKDIPWKKEWFPHSMAMPLSFWKSMENRKTFMEECSKKLHIKKPSDWGNIKAQTIIRLGGRVLMRYYRGSLYNCLQSIYKGSSIGKLSKA